MSRAKLTLSEDQIIQAIGEYLLQRGIGGRVDVELHAIDNGWRKPAQFSAAVLYEKAPDEHTH